MVYLPLHSKYYHFKKNNDTFCIEVPYGTRKK